MSRFRFGSFLILIAAVTFGVVFGGAYGLHQSWTPVAVASPTTTTTVPDPTSTTSTTVAPTGNGARSSAIVAENARPGSTLWKLYPGDQSTVVQGFASSTDATVGSTVTLYITSTAPTYSVQAYRMGYYGGTGGRLVWTSQPLVGHVQPACPLDRSVNMVSCTNWTATVHVPITAAFVPGDYLFKLVAAPREASYVPLTVWDPTSTSTYVIMNRPLVEQGWNTYGGYDFYAGLGGCIIDTISYPACNRAREVSFDRPFATGAGASDFLTNEYPLVYLMEKEGLNVSYITDITLSEHPGLLAHHTTLLSLDHDESWTLAERQAVVTATSHGMNTVFFGAAAMVRHVRLAPSAFGPDRNEIDYRNAGEDPLSATGPASLVTANTWADPPTNWSPISQIGDQYSGYLNIGTLASVVVTDASSWLYAGTGLRNGDTIPNALGSDIDHYVATPSTPRNESILSHSPVPTSTGTFSGQKWGGLTYADTVYFTNPVSHAGVLDTGNNIWIGDLMKCPATQVGCPQAPFITMTNNILRVFGHGPTGLTTPSIPNLSTISPAGS